MLNSSYHANFMILAFWTLFGGKMGVVTMLAAKGLEPQDPPIVGRISSRKWGFKIFGPEPPHTINLSHKRPKMPKSKSNIQVANVEYISKLTYFWYYFQVTYKT